MRKKKALTFQQALFLSARNVDLRFKTKELDGGYCNQDFLSLDFWINDGRYSEMCSQEWHIQEVTIPENHQRVKEFLKRNLDIRVNCESSRYNNQTLSSIKYWEDEGVYFGEISWKLDKCFSNINVTNVLKLMRKS